MNLKNTADNKPNFRSLSTSDIEELALFQANKNRRYTQLQAGQLYGSYVEVDLGKLHVFREKLSAGTLIEASPPSHFCAFRSTTFQQRPFKLLR